ncbi:MAG: phosphotransferase [Dehalococcoidia bacterium]|nr:phosphotransferase [Dehalococcoidia bacterium]
MPAARMHADEVPTDASLVGRLIAAQFPQWAGLPIRQFDSAGTTNSLYRLGDDMAVRLPRRPGTDAEIDKEHRWLPQLGPHLPLAIPVPLARGVPGEGYPWPWSVYRWLEGETATTEAIGDSPDTASALAEFVAALHRIDTAGGPAPGKHNYSRGVPLERRDVATRAAIASLEGVVDVDRVTAVWEAALEAPEWHGAPVWIHGDLLPSNMLVEQGRLSAIIDFGSSGVGDPACDVAVAWTLLSPTVRGVFREALAVDDATWARGRGWALSPALIALPYYTETNPAMVRTARHTITAVLEDYGREA